MFPVASCLVPFRQDLSLNLMPTVFARLEGFRLSSLPNAGVIRVQDHIHLFNLDAGDLNPRLHVFVASITH